MGVCLTCYTGLDSGVKVNSVKVNSDLARLLDIRASHHPSVTNTT